jgi:hypothetical protein
MRNDVMWRTTRARGGRRVTAVTEMMMWRTTMALMCTLAVLHLPAAEAAAKNFFMIVSFYSGRFVYVHVCVCSQRWLAQQQPTSSSSHCIMRSALCVYVLLVRCRCMSLPLSEALPRAQAVDDMRPMFGKSFGVEEVLTPNMDRHFTNGGGSAMQHSYVQIAVCGPSRASVLTGRRPDTTTVGVSGGAMSTWCWCQRGECEANNLFMTLPTWFAQHGYIVWRAFQLVFCLGTGACLCLLSPAHWHATDWCAVADSREWQNLSSRCVHRDAEKNGVLWRKRFSYRR